MRVKIGDNWYEPTAGAPIMIELTKQDKRNIQAMSPDATKYAVFAKGEPMKLKQMQEWME